MKPMTLVTLTGAVLLALSTGCLAAISPGDTAPDFTLTDTAGDAHTLSTYLEAGKIVVLEWFNPDCPFIKKHHQTNRTMNLTFEAVAGEAVVWLAINSGAAGKQGHGLERNREAHKEYEMPFPILLDEDGKVGRAYGAKTTPHMYVIDKDGKVAYAGAIDDNHDIRKLGETNHVAVALAAILGGKLPEIAETKPYGCSVKYGK